MTAAALLVVALVADDGTVLRNAPDDRAPASATLWRGDWLEVRGEAAGFLKVYDHRRERPGYVPATSVRVHKVDEASGPELRAVVLFLRDAAGLESLGIGYAALYLKVAGGPELRSAAAAEVFFAMGTMAERLARRASAARRASSDASLAGQLGVTGSYGVVLASVETGARTQLCYDGDAFARVVASGAAPPELRARAALALARPACPGARLGVPEARAWNEARLGLLGAVDPDASLASNQVPAFLAHRIRLGLAEGLATRAHDDARRGDIGAAARAENAAVRALALVDRGQLAPGDQADYQATAIRVAAGRWATAVAPGKSASPAATRAPVLEVSPRAPGETCVRLVRAGATPATGTAAPKKILVERCTYGVVWPASLRWAPGQRAAVLAVQTLAAWTELWVLQPARPRPGDKSASPAPYPWQITTLPPALAIPDDDVGYAEPAGFSPDGTRLLVVRESLSRGRLSRRFEVLLVESPGLRREIWASDPARLSAFRRWATPAWRGETLALR
jgi:hypothetical protein